MRRRELAVALPRPHFRLNASLYSFGRCSFLVGTMEKNKATNPLVSFFHGWTPLLHEQVFPCGEDCEASSAARLLARTVKATLIDIPPFSVSIHDRFIRGYTGAFQRKRSIPHLLWVCFIPIFILSAYIRQLETYTGVLHGRICFCFWHTQRLAFGSRSDVSAFYGFRVLASGAWHMASPKRHVWSHYGDEASRHQISKKT